MMKSKFLRTLYKPLHDKAQACLSQCRCLFLIYPVLELQPHQTTSPTEAFVSIIPQHPTWRIPRSSSKMLLRPSCPYDALGDLVKVEILLPSIHRSRMGPEVLFCTSNKLPGNAEAAQNARWQALETLPCQPSLYAKPLPYKADRHKTSSFLIV